MKVIIEIISRIGRGFICGVIALIIGVSVCLIFDISNFRASAEEHINAWRFIRIFTAIGAIAGLISKSWIIGGEKHKYYQSAIIGAFLGILVALVIAYLGGVCVYANTMAENHVMAEKVAGGDEIHFRSAFMLLGLPAGAMIGGLIGIWLRRKREKKRILF
ncbi:MAG: hypothetical protein ABSG67_18160 [Thermoguttaceae bacterium]|jgi:uncharacterized membrane protein